MAHSNKKTVRGEVRATECHICKKSGEAIHVYSAHNFRDLKGRVVCERFLQKLRENQCYKCKNFGHFASKCVVSETKKDIFVMIQKRLLKKPEPDSEPEPKKKSLPTNTFAALDFSSDEEEKPVKVKTTKVKDLDWGAESDDE